MANLEEIIAGGKGPAADANKGGSGQPPAPAAKDPEVEKKEGILSNLNKAIEEANGELIRIRGEIKKGPEGGQGNGAEDTPKINFEDPSAKAWENHIDGKVKPVQEELDKEKQEVRTFALREFLADKPALAKDANALKALMGYYERVRTASERTKEGVIADLRRAYAIVRSDATIEQGHAARIESATADGILADVATDGGSTGYRRENDSDQGRKLSEEDKNILARWGISPEEWKQEEKAANAATQ